MRALLDEMLSHRIARELRARGHDVESVNGSPDWEAFSDRAVLELARRTRRAVLTNNVRDYRPLHHEAVAPGGRGHFGMVFLSWRVGRSRGDSGRLVAAIEEVLAEHPGERDLVDAEVWLRLER